MSNAIIDNFSKEELQKIVEESTSLAENLPSKKTIINKYSDEEWLNI